jgi:hypothetical protein
VTQIRLFRNKKTGAVWEVADSATLQRITEDPQSYEEVKPESEKPKTKPEKSG